MDDNFWKKRNIAELAWFLTLGRMIPSLEGDDCLLEIQIGYLSDFTEILSFLMRSTFIEPKRKIRLVQFSRKSIFKTLKSDQRILRKLHPKALKWLRFGKRDTPLMQCLNKWEDEQWTRYKTEKQIQSFKSLEERESTYNKFLKELIEPKIQKAGGRDFIEMGQVERAIRLAREDVLEKINVIRNIARPKGLYAPEFNRFKELAFYIGEREKLEGLFQSIPHHLRSAAVDRHAKKIFNKIEATKESANPQTYKFLLTPRGKTPSLSSIKKKLANAALYIWD